MKMNDQTAAKLLDSIERNQQWFAKYSNVVQFGQALADAGFSAQELQDYYEKPWKWDWETYQRQKAIANNAPLGSKCTCPLSRNEIDPECPEHGD